MYYLLILIMLLLAVAILIPEVTLIDLTITLEPLYTGHGLQTPYSKSPSIYAIMENQSAPSQNPTTPPPSSPLQPTPPAPDSDGNPFSDYDGVD